MASSTSEPSKPEALSNDRKKKLRAIGHQLNPVVTVAGKGLTESVMDEIKRALRDHELIKIKFAVEDREQKQQLIESICEQTDAQLVQAIGHVALVLKEADNPDPKLSNLLRS